jgi:hypothetical protein
MIKTIWTIGKLGPFQLGGYPTFVLKTQVECQGPFDLGKNVSVFLTLSPRGNIVVIESQSMGIIGHNGLEGVKEDLSKDSEEKAKERIDCAVKWFDSHHHEEVDAEEFWSRCKI